MEKLKQYVVFTVLGCLVVLAAGYFLLVAPKRSDAADLRAQAARQQVDNGVLLNQLKVLRAQDKALPKQRADLARVAAEIPSSPALPALVRALSTAATTAGIELVTVAPGTPNVVAAPVAATTAATSSGTKTTGSRTVVASTVAGQLASIPLTLTVSGRYFPVEQFVSNIEGLSRAMRITNLVIAPGDNPVKPVVVSSGISSDPSNLLTTITGVVFMAANRPATPVVTLPGQAVSGTTVGPAAPVTPAKK